MAGFLIYGANGYTGTLIAHEAVAHGHRPILAGRNAQALATLASELRLEHRVFGLDNPEAVADDGEVVLPGFSLDPDQLRAAFDTVAAFGWNAVGLLRPEGPHVYVEGVFQGRDVYMQVLAYAPEGRSRG